MFKGLFRERQRVAAVKGLAALQGIAEPTLDRFVAAAATAFTAPIAAISLIGDDEQIIKASRGIPTGSVPRNQGFCTATLTSTAVLECCDPQRDPRFRDLPGVVGAPHARYYVGAPLLLLSGISVGALCVVDTVARPAASADQKAYLLGLARQASMTLENSLALRGHAA